MRLRRGWIGCITLLVLAAGPSVSRAIAPEDFARVRAQIESGDYRAAEAQARTLLSRVAAAGEPDSLDVAEALELLVETLRLGGSGLSPETSRLAERSLALRERALPADDPAVARSLHQLARLAFFRAEYENAATLLERTRSIRVARFGASDSLTAATLADLGMLEQARGNLDRAAELQREALRIRESVLGPRHHLTARSLSLLASVLQTRGELDEARRLYEQALAIADSTRPGHPDTAYILSGFGGLLMALGRIPEARLAQERALRIREGTLPPDHPDLAISQLNLGVLARRMELFEEAQRRFATALSIAEARLAPEHPLTALILNSYAGTLWQRGASAEALAYSGRALAIRERTLPADHPDLAQSHHNLAMLLEDLGRWGDAEVEYRKALAIYERAFGTEHPQIAVTLWRLAELLRASGRLEEALSMSTRALAMEEAGPARDSPDHANSLIVHGTLLRALGRSAEAIPLVTRARTMLAKAYGPSHPEVGRTGSLLARLQASSGDLDAALETALESERVGREHLRLCARTLSEDQALQAERVRATSLSVLLSLACDARSANPRFVEVAWDAVVRSRALILDELACRHRTDADRGSVGLADTRAALPEGAALVAYVRYGAMPVGSCTDAREAPEYAAFVLSPPSYRLEVVPLGEAGRIDSLIAGWRREVAREPTRAEAAASHARCQEAGRHLAAAVWDPLVAQLGDARRVFIAPDGAIHLVNFAALPAPSGAFLVEEGPTLHLLSAERDLATIPAESGRASAGFLAMGDPDFEARTDDSREHRASPGRQALFRGARAECAEFERLRWKRLPETGPEVSEARALWERGEQPADRSAFPAVVLTGSRATEAAFKELAPGRRAIHLATHAFFVSGRCRPVDGGGRGMGGFVEIADSTQGPPAGATPESPPDAAVPDSSGVEVDPVNPLRLSGIVLAGANHRKQARADQEDGILTAEEVASLDLSGTSWAVLSACDTGAGEIRSGEGVLGLRRAFQVAGARTLVLSLWPVGDQAARAWMESLYRARFVERLDTAEAVREASLRVLKARRAGGESTHPFFWAPFVAAGDWR